MTSFLSLLIAAALVPGGDLQPSPEPALDTLAIPVRGESREFAFTNKETAFLYGETHGEHRSGWQGFNVYGHEFLDDYLLTVDGKELRRAEATLVRVLPDHLVREYPGGIVERVLPVDSIPAFCIVVTAPDPVALTVVPLVTDARRREEFILTGEDGVLGIARASHRERTPERNYPVWIALTGRTTRVDTTAVVRGNRYGPARLASGRSREHIVAFAVADRAADASGAARACAADAGRFLAARRARMARLLHQTGVVTDDGRFNRALSWAKLSLDALMMNQVTSGIFAGLPWFNNYWGRDTFISLPGAALVTGRYREALAILRSFMAFQNADPSSREYGRIPNIVSTTDTAWNTADGTPRFVMMAAEYVRRSGDTAFIREVFPVVRRATEAALTRHVDSLGFLRHGDAETWMDAVGPAGPWSPRGDRANDIQALWAGQLEAAAWMADRMQEPQAATRWREALGHLRANFMTYFVTPEGIADRLLSDGTADTRVRPNQVFAGDLLSGPERAAMLRTVVREMTYEYGVASLAQSDVDFHPWHQAAAFYPKDAAYHNGTVWTWLQGPVIGELCRCGYHELAFRITGNSVSQILDRDAAGTQSELLDALPQSGSSQPRASGTFSQAWNLAEFVRNFYDDYLGLRIDRTAHTMTLTPRLPERLGRVRARINLDGPGLDLDVAPERTGMTLEAEAHVLRHEGTVVLTLPAGEEGDTTVRFTLPPRSRFRVEQRGRYLRLLINGREHIPEPVRAVRCSIVGDLSLAVPRSPAGLRTLKGPNYPLLDHTTITLAADPGAKPLLEARDPGGDDTGVKEDGSSTSSYTYPRTPHLLPGSLDLLGISIAASDSLAFFTLRFRALSNPGWHPEYGFQLTYVALAFDRDGREGTGRSGIGWNSAFSLPEGRGFERLVLVGGGIRVEDENGRPIAAYVPLEADAARPMGNAAEGSISFALPLRLVGPFENGCILDVLVGAQDDHGGAGLGEFRSVQAGPASEWTGGGKENEENPNLYDRLQITIEKP